MLTDAEIAGYMGWRGPERITVELRGRALFARSRSDAELCPCQTEREMDLVLPLKGEYFDQIKAGTKTEEYRLVNDYWRARLYLKKFDRIVLMRGYPKRDDAERRMVLPWKGYRVTEITHPHFGPEPVNVFAIDVGHNDCGEPGLTEPGKD